MDFTNYSEIINGGKLTENNVWKHIQNKEVECVSAYNDCGADAEVNENITASKAYKILCEKYGETEKENCSVTFFVKYDNYGDIEYRMIDFTL